MFSFSARSNYNKLDKIIGKNHYHSQYEVQKSFLNITLRQCFKGCNIFQRVWKLVRLRTLTFTPKESNKIFFKILFFFFFFFFFCITFFHFPLLFVYGKAEWQCIQCQIAAEIIDMSFSNVFVVSFRQQCVFWTFV